MFRAGIALPALAAFSALAPVASAQPRQLPLSPGVMPASPFGPGMPFPAAPVPQSATANTVFFPVALPWGWGLGWGYQTYNPWTGYGYTYGGLVPSGYAAPQQAIMAQPQRPEPTVVTVNEFPATLTLQFPAAAEVWLDGKKVKGDPAQEQVLTSPVLKPDQKYTFLVKARWTKGEKTYEAKRTVTLNGGDRSRLFVVSGDEIRE